jgi:hypothetical protein
LAPAREANPPASRTRTSESRKPGKGHSSCFSDGAGV